MLFITENDIREEYNKSCFEHYQQKKGVKLTPAARQFLLDRRVVISDGRPIKTSVGGYGNLLSSRENNIDRMLHIKINLLENLFLTSAGDFIQSNSCLRKTLIKLYQRVHELHATQSAEKQENSRSCGVEKDEFPQEFELAASCMLSPNWQEILCLHRLLCAVEEFDCFVEQKESNGFTDFRIRVGRIRHSIIKLLRIANGADDE